MHYREIGEVMSYTKIGDGVVALFYFLVALAVIFVPLGIWKLVDIAKILVDKISITVN